LEGEVAALATDVFGLCIQIFDKRKVNIIEAKVVIVYNVVNFARIFNSSTKSYIALITYLTYSGK
jgi:hypothetical protein